MTTRARAVHLKSPRSPSASVQALASGKGHEANSETAEAPFVTTLTVEESELHRVSFAPLYLHESRPSKRCEPFYLSAPPEITFTPDDNELHPLTLAISPITITLPGLSGVSALKPAEVDPLLGHIIADKYKLLARVGRGGTGIVYKAEQIATGRILALKVLTKDITTRRHALSQLRQEAKVTAKLTHEHTVKMLDFAENEQFVYLAMEYLQGKDLATVLRREGPLSEERAIAVALQICQSVAEAHAQGIVHRDIKPENVFLVQTGQPTDFAKVLDFGVAQLHGSEALGESKSLVYGTPNYMAPEQIRGEIVDARTDVYALGALLYKAVSGVAPFAGETPKAVLDKHLHEQAVPMRARLAGLEVSDALEAIVAKALRKDPAQRQQSMHEIQRELAAILSPQPTVTLTVNISVTATTAASEGRPVKTKKAKKSKNHSKGKSKGKSKKARRK